MSRNQPNQQLIGKLLAPSLFSAAVAIFAGLVVTIGVIAAFETHDSSVQQQLVAWQPEVTQQTTLTTPGQSLPENDHPTLKGSWPLIILWSFVGLAVYAVTM